MRTLTSNTLEIGSRTWAMDTRMRSWKRRKIPVWYFDVLGKELEVGRDACWGQES
jgi:hypothetical protein